MEERPTPLWYVTNTRIMQEFVRKKHPSSAEIHEAGTALRELRKRRAHYRNGVQAFGLWTHAEYGFGERHSNRFIRVALRFAPEELVGKRHNLKTLEAILDQPAALRAQLLARVHPTAAAVAQAAAQLAAGP